MEVGKLHIHELREEVVMGGRAAADHDAHLGVLAGQRSDFLVRLDKVTAIDQIDTLISLLLRESREGR